MSMNIRRDLKERLYHILGMSQVPPELSVKGSVQPIIDYHKTMVKHETITIPATAGNVSTQITPGVETKITVIYGGLYLDTDATAANRTFRFFFYEVGGNRILEYVSATIIADKIYALALRKATNLDSVRTGGGATPDTEEYIETPFSVYETDYLHLSVTNGVAGDSYQGKIKVLEEYIGRET